LAKRLGPLCDFVYGRAARIVAQSEGMRARLLDRGVGPGRVVTIYNWADGAADAPADGSEEAADLAGYGFDGRFTFVFAGNLGIVQGLDTLVEATRMAAARDPRVRLLIVGDGVEHHRIAALARSEGAGAVSVYPGVSRARIVGILRAADALLVHLIDNPLFEVTIPSKVQFNLAMGKPLLIAMKGEAARLVLESGGGVSVPPEQPLAMADAMLALASLPSETLSEMGSAAAASYRSRFSFAAGLSSTIKVLEAATSSHPSRLSERPRIAASSD
jgi:glycosyltransferase involved in cell wall biosynthesis